jgi:hypothetical protein
MSYDRRKFMRALDARGFRVLREGANHTIVGMEGMRPEPVPRHREINRITARKIAKNLGINWAEIEREIR